MPDILLLIFPPIIIWLILRLIFRRFLGWKSFTQSWRFDLLSLALTFMLGMMNFAFQAQIRNAKQTGIVFGHIVWIYLVYAVLFLLAAAVIRRFFARRCGKGF